MLEDDIQQLRAILGHVVTLGADTPQTRPYLNHVYAGLTEALTALEQLQEANNPFLPADEPLMDAADLAFLASLGVPRRSPRETWRDRPQAPHHP